jgi:hypothetical protein
VDLIASSGGTGNWADNPGDGTVENPYQIATAGQLDVLGADPTLWDKHFVLTADLDLVGRTYTTAVVAPDSNNATEGFQGTPFSGTFDGRGHAIRNLTIAPILQIQYEYVGLFGMVAQSGRIRDLNVLDADVSTTGNRIVTVGVLVVVTIRSTSSFRTPARSRATVAARNPREALSSSNRPVPLSTAPWRHFTPAYRSMMP